LLPVVASKIARSLYAISRETSYTTPFISLAIANLTDLCPDVRRGVRRAATAARREDRRSGSACGAEKKATT